MMKKVTFVCFCLLSLFVCFSEPSAPVLDAAAQTPPVPATVLQPNAAATGANATEGKTEQPVTAAAATSVTPPVVTARPQNATEANFTKDVLNSNETSTKTNETKPAEKNNSTEAATPNAVPAKPVVPSKGNNETKPESNVPANNGTNAGSKDGTKNETTTPKGENVKPTVAPVEAKSRAFDGPSFIGGIILTLGLLAIGFMGFKYYKNQTERNYHTL